MSFHQKYRPVVQLACAISILWIYAGALVNFHQHHLWRKQLIPQVVSSLNKNDKSKVTARFDKKSQENNSNGNDLSAALLNHSGNQTILVPVSAVLLAHFTPDVIRDNYFLSQSLRGPPPVL